MGRRMFSTDITESDAFVDMPGSTQALYFHLGMYVDHEGFVGNPKQIMRKMNASDDDMKLLEAKRFIISFPSGIIVIKHHLMHNQIRKDRFIPTVYTEERKLIFIKENGSYTDSPENGKPLLETTQKIKKQTKRIAKTPKIENSIQYLKSIPEDDMKEMSQKYSISEHFIKLRADDVFTYCGSKGRKYSNYKMALINFIKTRIREHPEEKIKPVSYSKPIETVELTEEQRAENSKKIKEMKESLSGKFSVKAQK
jgi:hypothetical protein